MVCLPITAVVVDDHFGRKRNCPQGRFDRTDGAANLAVPAFGWKVPDYIHLPLALNPQGAKLSKQNHAPALPKGDPRPVLIAALHFLGQQVETHWQDFSVEQILQSAVKNWTLTAVPESAIVNSTFSNASC